MATDPRLLQAKAKADAYDRAHAEGYVDEGLRSHMLKVYNYMASGLALTAIVAAGMNMASESLVMWFATGYNLLIPFGALLVLTWFFAPRMLSMSTMGAQALFWSVAALYGVVFSIYFLIFTGESLALTFAITSAMFASMSLWGYTTKRDLTGMGSFLAMGSIGLLIAIVANMFIGSEILHFATSAIGVVIFTLMTAFSTQNIKSLYFYLEGTDMMEKGAVSGALQLYLDFVGIFIFLIQFLGVARE